jgi:hypothetical protein
MTGKRVLSGKSAMRALWLPCLLGITVAAHAQTPPRWRLGVGLGPLFLAGGETGSYGPVAVVGLGRRVGARVFLQGLAEAAPLTSSGGEEVTSPGPCGSCDVVVGPREARLALAASLEARLYDHPGERGGYASLGFGLARYAPRFGGGSSVRPRVHLGLGGVVSANPTSMFFEARIANTLDPIPYPRWGFSLLLGWRFGV